MLGVTSLPRGRRERAISASSSAARSAAWVALSASRSQAASCHMSRCGGSGRNTDPIEDEPSSRFMPEAACEIAPRVTNLRRLEGPCPDGAMDERLSCVIAQGKETSESLSEARSRTTTKGCEAIPNTISQYMERGERKTGPSVRITRIARNLMRHGNLRGIATPQLPHHWPSISHQEHVLDSIAFGGT